MNAELKVAQTENGLENDAEIEYCQPSFEVKKFAVQISDAEYHFQILKSEGLLFVCIGTEVEDKLVNLSLGMPTSYDRVPVATSILGDSVNQVSSNLAKRISCLLKKPVYISCNVTTDRLVLPLLEKHLIALTKSNPNAF